MNVKTLYCNLCLCQILHDSKSYRGVGYDHWGGGVRKITDPNVIQICQLHLCDSCNIKFETLFTSAADSIHDKLDTILDRVSHIVPLTPRE